MYSALTRQVHTRRRRAQNTLYSPFHGQKRAWKVQSMYMHVAQATDISLAARLGVRSPRRLVSYYGNPRPNNHRRASQHENAREHILDNHLCAIYDIGMMVVMVWPASLTFWVEYHVPFINLLFRVSSICLPLFSSADLSQKAILGLFSLLS